MTLMYRAETVRRRFRNCSLFCSCMTYLVVLENEDRNNIVRSLVLGSFFLAVGSRVGQSPFPFACPWHGSSSRSTPPPHPTSPCTHCSSGRRVAQLNLQMPKPMLSYLCPSPKPPKVRNPEPWVLFRNEVKLPQTSPLLLLVCLTSSSSTP